jgi:hypothetical protein
MPQPRAKIKKERPEKRFRKKIAKKIKDMDFGAAATISADVSVDDADDEDGSRTNISIDVTEDEASTVDHFSAQ